MNANSQNGQASLQVKFKKKFKKIVFFQGTDEKHTWEKIKEIEEQNTKLDHDMNMIMVENDVLRTNLNNAKTAHDVLKRASNKALNEIEDEVKRLKNTIDEYRKKFK